MQVNLSILHILLQTWVFSALASSYPGQRLQSRAGTVHDYFLTFKPGLPGHCDGTVVDVMVEDARTLLNAAILSLSLLLGPNIPSEPDNKVYAEAAMNIWGAKFSEEGDFIRLTNGQEVLEVALSISSVSTPESFKTN